MATFVQSSRLTNGGNINKNGKQRKEVRLLTSKKGKKRNSPSMTIMFKGYLMNLWLQNLSLSWNQSDLLRSIRQMILSTAYSTRSLVTP